MSLLAYSICILHRLFVMNDTIFLFKHFICILHRLFMMNDTIFLFNQFNVAMSQGMPLAYLPCMLRY